MKKREGYRCIIQSPFSLAGLFTWTREGMGERERGGGGSAREGGEGEGYRCIILNI